MKGLDAYKMPENEKIVLPGSDVQFIVRLPTQWNRGYQRHWQDAISQHGTMEGDEFVVKGLSAVAFQDAQLQAFVGTCMVEVPDGMTAELLLADYYPAADTLFRIARERATEVEAHAKIQTGK